MRMEARTHVTVASDVHVQCPYLGKAFLKVADDWYAFSLTLVERPNRYQYRATVHRRRVRYIIEASVMRLSNWKRL